jgi:hypothetical protein
MFVLQADGDIPLSIFLITELWIYVPTIMIIVTITSKSFVDRSSSIKP